MVFGGNANEFGQVGVQGWFAPGQFDQDRFRKRCAEALELFRGHVFIGAVTVVAVVAGHIAARRDVDQYGRVGVLGPWNPFAPRRLDCVVGLKQFVQLSAFHWMCCLFRVLKLHAFGCFQATL